MLRSFSWTLTGLFLSHVSAAQCPIQTIDARGPVAVSGDVALIGVPDENVATLGGAVHVYADTGSTWDYVETLRPASSTPGDEFGQTLALDGDWALVSNHVSGSPAELFFFRRTASGWAETQSVTRPGGGYSPMALRGNRAVVAGEDAAGVESLEVYELQGSTWSVVQQLRPHIPTNRIESVALTQDSIWAGVPLQAVVFVFEQRQGAWRQVTRLRPEESGFFGDALASDGQRVVVGALTADFPGGAAFVYERIGGEWTETQRLETGHEAGNSLGLSACLRGDVLALGAGGWFEIFRRGPSGWSFDQFVESSRPEGLGHFLALSNDDGRVLATAQDGTDVIDLDQVEPPFTYCTSTINSTGARGTLTYNGFTSLATNDFSLRARFAGVEAPGLFFYGDQALQLPFGDGFRCVGGNVTRLLPPVVTGMMGHASHILDFTQPPFSSGPGQITPGSTWRFQFWFRDTTGMSVSDFNTTDALEVTFCP